MTNQENIPGNSLEMRKRVFFPDIILTSQVISASEHYNAVYQLSVETIQRKRLNNKISVSTNESLHASLYIPDIFCHNHFSFQVVLTWIASLFLLSYRQSNKKIPVGFEYLNKFEYPNIISVSKLSIKAFTNYERKFVSQVYRNLPCKDLILGKAPAKGVKIDLLLSGRYITDNFCFWLDDN